jgi:cytochrome bd-type quinol oxidase subunit 2
MANSKTIAGLIGPSLIALAAALLINLGSMSALVEAVSHDPALVLVSGVLSFVAGLAVVRVHNHWAADWAVLVTIFGWLLLIGGLVRMLFPMARRNGCDLQPKHGPYCGGGRRVSRDRGFPVVQGLH